ncbi:MAG: B12-binding domain-containing radical SAM protein [Planctomycetota bacterium]
MALAIISAVLKKAGHQINLIDTTFGMKDREILSRVKRFNPDLIALSCVTNNFSYACYVANLIKQENNTPIIIGGVHATIDPEETILKENFDMVCIGEGEDAILELIDSMERGEKNTDIRNIWFKENGRIIKNPLRYLCEDLDKIPFADLSIFDYPRYLNHHNRVASFLGGRGCPYQCAYCINHTTQQLYRDLGKFVRYRNVDNVINEVKSVLMNYDIKAVSFYDDTFTLNKKRVKEFCQKFRNEIGLPFYINGRVDNITEEMCRDLHNAGCQRVSIGLESGDPIIRKKVLKRNITDEQIISTINLLKKYDIEQYAYNMIGIPGEKMRNIRKTIELNRKIRPTFLATTLFTAYKGTALHEKCKKEGLLDESASLNNYFSSSNVRHPFVSRRRLNHIRKWFGFYVFIGYDIKRAFIELLDRHLITNRFYSRFRTFFMTKYLLKSDRKKSCK